MEKLTKKDIIRSVEFSYKMHAFIMFMIAYIMMLALSIYICLELKDIVEMRYLVVISLLPSIVLLPFVLYFFFKLMYLLLFYDQFDVVEVSLDCVRTSYNLDHSVYFEVYLGPHTLKTSAIFSDVPFSKYRTKDFQFKKVLGLVDKEKQRLYIIKVLSDK